MLHVLKKEFKEFTRDKSAWFFTILFPSLMVFLLGNLLAYMDSSDAPVGVLKAQYLVEADDPRDVQAVQAFLDGCKGNSSIVLTEAEGLDTATQLVKSNEISGVVVFRSPLAIELYEGGNNIQNRALRSALTAFSKTVSAVSAVMDTAPQNLSSITSELDSKSLIKQKDLGLNRTMLDYYAVTMTVMILFMGGIGGASSFQDERRDNTLRRMKLSPVNPASLYVQKVLGAVPQAFLQAATIMLSSTLLFGAHYASTWNDNLLLFALFFMCGFAVIALCAILGIFLKMNATLVLMPVLWGLMFLSGTFSKEIYIEGITNYSPIYAMQTAAFDLTVFGRNEKALTALAICAVVFVLALAFGAFLFKRREEHA